MFALDCCRQTASLLWAWRMKSLRAQRRVLGDDVEQSHRVLGDSVVRLHDEREESVVIASRDGCILAGLECGDGMSGVQWSRLDQSRAAER